MLYTLPNGERIETDDVTAIIVYLAWKVSDVHVDRRGKGLAVFRFESEADALKWGQALLECCSAEVKFNRRMMNAWIPRFRDGPSGGPLYSRSELKKHGLCPRTGASPVSELFQCYTADNVSTWHFGPERIKWRLWQLDQAVLLVPPGSSPTLACAIMAYNAEPTYANKDMVSVAMALR